MAHSAAGVKQAHGWRRPGASLALSVLLVAATWGCSQRCKEMGCFSWARVTYSQPVSVPYDLTISTRGLALSTHCPQPRREATPVGSQEAQLGCDGSSFEVSVAHDHVGTGRYGENTRDADPISFKVTVTPRSPNLPPLKGEALVRIRNTGRPNGPDCSPICYGRGGTVTLAP